MRLRRLSESKTGKKKSRFHGRGKKENEAAPAKVKRRRGSAFVLLCILFVSLTGALAVTYEAADRKAAIAVSEAAFELAGRSQLACYDKDLFDRYSIFAFEGDEEQTGRRIKKTAADSIAKNEIAHCSVKDVEVEQSAYSVADPDNFMLQLRQIEKKSVVPDTLRSLKDDLGVADKKIREKEKGKKTIEQLEQQREAAKKAAAEAEQAAAQAGENQAAEAAAAGQSLQDIEKAEKIQNDLKKNAKDITDKADNSTIKDEDGGRELRNGEISENLPSRSAGKRSGSAFSGGTVIKDLSTSGDGAVSDDLITIAYIESRFRNKLDPETSDKSFFKGEMEYILYGCMSDRENCGKAYRAIFTIRLAVNTAFLFTDPEKSSATMAAAEVLTPGAFAPLTRLLIITAWAAVEAENDMKNLEDGRGVPFLKSSSSWMTDIDSAVNGTSGEGYIPIPGNSIMKYHRYLEMLMLTMDRDTKLYRCMDLIQINLKGTVRDDFTIADHYTGLVISASVSKKSHAVGVPGSEASIKMAHTYFTEK